MLFLEHAGSKARGIVAPEHGHRRLRDDGAAIERRRDVMHGTTMNAHTGGKRLRVGMYTGASSARSCSGNEGRSDG